MNAESKGKIVVGSTVQIVVTEFNDRPILSAEFVYYDEALRGVMPDVNLRSVRIYQPDAGEKFVFSAGEVVRAEIKSFNVAKNMTKDGRHKIYITVSNVRRIFSWTRYLDWGMKWSDRASLRLVLGCGSRQFRTKTIPLSKEQQVFLCAGKVNMTRALLLPSGVIIRRVVDWQTSVGEYLASQKAMLGKIASASTLERFRKNLKEVDAADINRIDRDALRRARIARRGHY